MLRCPRCGREPLVTPERIRGFAPVAAIGDDGSLDFEGETELVWEDSVSDGDPASGETLLFCRNAGCLNVEGTPISVLRRQLPDAPPPSPARPAPGHGRDARW